MNTKESERTTLDDKQLIIKCRDWISKLCKDANSWTLEVPVNPNRDPDMLFSELADRYEKLVANDSGKSDNDQSPLEARVIQHPQLFTNGKFYVQHPDFNNDTIRIEGYDNMNKAFIIERCNVDLKYSKLVARPITDMSDEELKLFNCTPELRDNFMNDLEIHIRNRELTLEESLVLIDIGVYPFEQAHFECEFLIDASAV